MYDDYEFIKNITHNQLILKICVEAKKVENMNVHNSFDAKVFLIDNDNYDFA